MYISFLQKETQSRILWTVSMNLSVGQWWKVWRRKPMVNIYLNNYLHIWFLFIVISKCTLILYNERFKSYMKLWLVKILKIYIYVYLFLKVQSTLMYSPLMQIEFSHLSIQTSQQIQQPRPLLGLFLTLSPQPIELD